jgi:hypothetical protein
LPERLRLLIDGHRPKGRPPTKRYGHVWVTISLALRHPKWGALALPLRAALYVRQRTMASIPKCRRWPRFATNFVQQFIVE